MAGGSVGWATGAALIALLKELQAAHGDRLCKPASEEGARNECTLLNISFAAAVFLCSGVLLYFLAGLTARLANKCAACGPRGAGRGWQGCMVGCVGELFEDYIALVRKGATTAACSIANFAVVQRVTLGLRAQVWSRQVAGVFLSAASRTSPLTSSAAGADYRGHFAAVLCAGRDVRRLAHFDWT